MRWAILCILVMVGLEAAAPANTREQADVEDLARRLTELLSHEFRVHTTDHFVLVYDTDEAFARGRGALLERTYTLFEDSFSRNGPSPSPLETRLVCLVFAEYDDYARYAAAADDDPLAYAGGYYSLVTNRIALHDDRTSPQFDETARRIAELESELEAIREELSDARRRGEATGLIRERMDLMLREHRWLGNRMQVIAVGSNDAKATHEAAHQLAFNRGVQNAYIENPFWLTEGLASNFESRGPDLSFGPYSDNPYRRGLLIESHKRNRLMDLERFSAMTTLPEGLDHHHAAELYAQAWGLFKYLFTHHHEALRRYFEVLATPTVTPRDEWAMRELFEESFGPIPALDRDFSRYIRALRKG